MLLRLDRVVANEGWKALFLKAMVHHVPTSASDHCLFALLVKTRVLLKPKRRRFFFEEM